jgi:hypothetical protein
VLVDRKEIDVSKIETFPDAELTPGEVLIRASLEGVTPGTSVDPRVMLAAGIDDPLCRDREAVGLLSALVKDVGDVIEPIHTKLF